MLFTGIYARHRYTEESCINARFDEAVVANKQSCFDACPQPLNKTGACYAKSVENIHMTVCQPFS